MPIVTIPINEADSRRAAEFVNGVTRPEESSSRLLSVRPQQPHYLALPHERYEIPLDSILSGSPRIEGPFSTGFVHFVENQPQAIAAFTDFERPGFIQTEDREANSLLAALARAEEIEAVREQDFQLRVVYVPALYVSALWLHGPANLFLDLSDTQSVMTLDEFHAHLQTLAKRQLAGRGIDESQSPAAP